MASSLIDTLAGDFDPSQYADGYREALTALVEAKVAGHDVVAPTESAEASSGTVVDLMAALRASVKAAKQGRPTEGAAPAAAQGEDEPQPSDAAPPPTKPSSRKPASGKKGPAAEKEPAKRPAAGKARRSA